MTSTDIEINWLRNEIIPKLLRDQKFLPNMQKNELEKFHLKDITVDFIGTQEAFMLTSCYRACVTYEYKGVVDKLHIFVKKTPQLPQEMFDLINFKSLFTNELLGYDKIMPHVEKFGSIKLNIAKLYYGNLESNSAILITEDFTSHGWRLTKDRVNLSLEHILMAMQYLGRFHGATFALRLSDRKTFDNLTRDIQESRYASDDVHSQWKVQVKASIRRTAKVAGEQFKELPKEFLEKFAKFEETFQQYCKNRVQPREPMVTLCHGDYLRNNIAFKYDDDDNEGTGSPRDIMMFDLQTLRVTSPMIDVVTFMCLSTFAEVRHKNFEKIMRTYYENVKETFESITQQSLPEYLSYDELLREYLRYLPYGILTAAPFLGVIMEPIHISTQEMLLEELSEEQLTERAMLRGGQQLDNELAHQIKEMYDLAKEHNIQVL